MGWEYVNTNPTGDPCAMCEPFVGMTFEIHNGKIFHKVMVTEEMVGHKLGEFSPSRSFRGHAGHRKKD